jgi:hypothetical protein
LGDVAALQSLDGKHHFPKAALGRFSSTVTAGQLAPFDDSGKQSSERLLHSETCRKTNSHNSAIPADDVYSIEWSLWYTLPTLAPLPA